MIVFENNQLSGNKINLENYFLHSKHVPASPLKINCGILFISDNFFAQFF